MKKLELLKLEYARATFVLDFTRFSTRDEHFCYRIFVNKMSDKAKLQKNLQLFNSCIFNIQHWLILK